MDSSCGPIAMDWGSGSRRSMKYTGDPDKTQELTAVNLDLAVLRMLARLARLAHELSVLPHKYAVREITEIGSKQDTKR